MGNQWRCPSVGGAEGDVRVLVLFSKFNVYIT